VLRTLLLNVPDVAHFDAMYKIFQHVTHNVGISCVNYFGSVFTVQFCLSSMNKM